MMLPADEASDVDESVLVNVRMATQDDNSPYKNSYALPASQRASIDCGASFEQKAPVSAAINARFEKKNNNNNSLLLKSKLNDMSRERRSPENFHPPPQSAPENSEFNVQVTDNVDTR